MIPDGYRAETLKISRPGVEPLTDGQVRLARYVLEIAQWGALAADAAKKMLFHGAPDDGRLGRILDSLTYTLAAGHEWRAYRSYALDERASRAVLYGLGLLGEAGEVAATSVALLDGDAPNDAMAESVLFEAGDVLWYLDRMLGMFEATTEDAMEANVAKLRRRYPDGWEAADKHYGHES